MRVPNIYTMGLWNYSCHISENMILLGEFNFDDLP